MKWKHLILSKFNTKCGILFELFRLFKTFRCVASKYDDCNGLRKKKHKRNGQTMQNDASGLGETSKKLCEKKLGCVNWVATGEKGKMQSPKKWV